jgi:hypothetical protein
MHKNFQGRIQKHNEITERSDIRILSMIFISINEAQWNYRHQQVPHQLTGCFQLVSYRQGGNSQVTLGLSHS